jgi:opacity protein-like surface antigen
MGWGHARRIIGILGVVVGLGGSALAADLPPSPPPRAPAVYVPAVLPVYNWAGIYVGINGGWGWGSTKYTANARRGRRHAWSQFPGRRVCVRRRRRLGLLRNQYRHHREHLHLQRQLPNRQQLAGDGAGARRLCRRSRPALRHRRRRLRQCADELQRHDADNWTAKVEYLYVNLGNGSVNCATAACLAASTGTPIPVSVGLTENLFRAGVNFKFSF